LKIIKG